MEIISKREEMIFKNERDWKISYSIGVSKKNQDGTYEKGYIPVKFPKNIELKSQTKILIKEAWLDFFKIDKRTIPYIFINKFELASEVDAIKQVQEEKELPFY